MYIITVAGQEEKGAYTVYDDVGDRIIYIFQEVRLMQLDTLCY